jgi:AraC family transcriptional regulator
MSDLSPTAGSQGAARAGAAAGALRGRSGSRPIRRDRERPPLRLLPDTGDEPHGDRQSSGQAVDVAPAGPALRLDPPDTRGSRFRGGLPGGALRRVRAYIDDHIGQRISLDELARQAGVSRFHFARQFRLSTGESPMQYLRRVRVERSMSILQSRGTTIAEVAAKLGFSDQSHFTRIFGRLVGVSPGSFARCDDWGSRAVAGEGLRRMSAGST